MAEQEAEPNPPDPTAMETRTEREPDVSNPAEMIRLANMFQALMTEVRELELDEAGRKRLFDIHRHAIEALKDLLSDDLEEELESLGLPIEEADASGPALRVAQAQLVGWLNGVFQGMQASVMAQQMAAGRQMGQLPQGLSQERPQLADDHAQGQYL
ncbi:MAG: proteasome activator [Acidimicrobiales bacterium]|nr:proteasome activator [Acidimicrobiales bacterium]